MQCIATSRTAWVLLFGVLFSPACTCGRLEIGPSNLIAVGRFEAVWGHPWGDRQQYVLADRVDADGGPPLLTVVRVGETLSCDLRVQHPNWYFSMKSSLLAFEAIDWNKWRGRLVEVGLPCGPVKPLLEDVYLSLWRDEAETELYVVANVGADGVGRLVRMEWPSGPVHEVRARQSTDYLNFDWPAPRMFYREDGHLVAATLAGVEEGRFGQGVTYYASDGKGEVIYEQRPQMFRARIGEGRVEQLSVDGCHPSFADDWLVHYEPCLNGPRQILVRDRETNVELLRLGANVTRYRLGPKRWLSWMEGPANAPTGALWVKPELGEPQLIAEGVLPSWWVLPEARRVMYAVPTSDKRARLVSYDLSRREGTVMSEDVDANLPISESPWSPHWAMVESPRAMALADGGVSADRVGALVGIHPGTFERVPIADGVPTRGFRFSWQAPAIGYLRNHDLATDTGHFEVMNMVDRSRISVDKGVRLFEEVYGPTKGVVYQVDEPGRLGLYFVKAEVHLF